MRAARSEGGLTGVRLDGPNCYYCGRPLAQVATDGCGSQEFPGMTQEQRNALCEVYDRARRGPTPGVS